MERVPDDPIIRCMERTGYPPWWSKIDPALLPDDDDFGEEDEDVYFGNENDEF